MASGPLALITGGSSGIGAATAAALAADDWRVVVVARGAAGLHDVRDRIAATGGTIAAEVADASDGDAVVALADRVVAEHGVPNAIVNAAGAGEWRFAEETDPALAVQMMGAPYHAAFNTASAFLPGMLERGSGALIHVGSPASFIPWPGATAYAAARWALRGLHEALRQDLRGTGITTSHVVFGEVTSPYFETNAVGGEQLPWLSRVVPAISPERCAAVLHDTIRTPRPQVIYPPVVRALVLMGRAVPPAGRRLAALGARSH